MMTTTKNQNWTVGTAVPASTRCLLIRHGRARGVSLELVIPTAEPVTSPISARSRFTLYAWGVLAWNVFVVLWGAFVRASGSGAGCGNNWPLCNGGIMPQASRLDSIIEF